MNKKTFTGVTSVNTSILIKIYRKVANMDAQKVALYGRFTNKAKEVQ